MNSRRFQIIVSCIVLFAVVAACSLSPKARQPEAQPGMLAQQASLSADLPEEAAATPISRFQSGPIGPTPAPAALWERIPIPGP